MTSYLDLEEIVFSGRRRRAGPEPNADTPIATVPEAQADAGQPVVRRAKRARFVKRAPCNLAYEYDPNASSDVVLERITGILHGILDALQAGELPCFRESLPAVDAAGAAGQKKPSELSFSPSNEKTSLKLLRALVVLEIVQKLHTEDRTQTQRDIYYEVHCQDLFPTPVSVNTAIEDVGKMLAIPRSAMNITTASGKGRVAGCLRVHTAQAGRWTDCQNGPYSVPGDVLQIETMAFQSQALYILVIEKEAVFQALAGDQIYQRLPCILVTASGMPDIATRAFISGVLAACPRMQCIGLADYNPSGVHILLNYRFGGQKSNREAVRFAAPGLKWLGVHHHMLATDCDAGDMQALTPLDIKKISNLLLPASRAPADWQPELLLMEKFGKKAEIEAAYKLRGVRSFCNMMVTAMREHDWL